MDKALMMLVVALLVSINYGFAQEYGVTRKVAVADDKEADVFNDKKVTVADDKEVTVANDQESAAKSDQAGNTICPLSGRELNLNDPNDYTKLVVRGHVFNVCPKAKSEYDNNPSQYKAKIAEAINATIARKTEKKD